MSGLSVKLPLVVSNVFGPYDLNTTFDDLAKQNLKMLVLTNPGERIMYPNFGVGISRYLFENNTTNTYDSIRSRLQEQVDTYMSYIQIDHVDFSAREDNPDLFPNSIRLSIFFTIVPLKQITSLQININN